MLPVITLLLLCVACICQLPDVPKAHKIANVPYHRQTTGYACGDASFEMVAHYFGTDLNQHAIIDVVRTSDHEGTQSYDLIRGGHFSSLSSTPSQYKVLFPEVAPQNGWNKDRKLGMASFGYRNDSECYINDVVRVISNDIPVIVLMKLNLQGGGHYRVVIGYEWDGKGYTMTLLDPWDRKNNTRTVKYDQDLFCNMWNHREPIKFPSNVNFEKPAVPMPNNVDYYPAHFAAVMYPWKVTVEHDFDPKYMVSEQNGSNIIVTANIEYQCFKPFCVPGQGPIADAVAILTYPAHMTLTQGDSSKIEIGAFAPGDKTTIQWHMFVQDQDSISMEMESITVDAFGKIKASVPEMWYDKDVSSPAYDYEDIIGGTASVHY